MAGLFISQNTQEKYSSLEKTWRSEIRDMFEKEFGMHRNSFSKRISGDLSCTPNQYEYLTNLINKYYRIATNGIETKKSISKQQNKSQQVAA